MLVNHSLEMVSVHCSYCSVLPLHWLYCCPNYSAILFYPLIKSIGFVLSNTCWRLHFWLSMIIFQLFIHLVLLIKREGHFFPKWCQHRILRLSVDGVLHLAWAQMNWDQTAYSIGTYHRCVYTTLCPDLQPWTSCALPLIGYLLVYWACQRDWNVYWEYLG